ESHPLVLGCKERSKNVLQMLLLYSRSRIAHLHDHKLVLPSIGLHGCEQIRHACHDRKFAALGHCLNGVLDDVQENLDELVLASVNIRQAWVIESSENYSSLPCALFVQKQYPVQNAV